MGFESLIIDCSEGEALNELFRFWWFSIQTNQCAMTLVHIFKYYLRYFNSQQVIRNIG